MIQLPMHLKKLFSNDLSMRYMKISFRQDSKLDFLLRMMISNIQNMLIGKFNN